jgi:uncharacterized protein GlcG (DUF336 family)
MSRNITLEQAENIIEACKAEARSVGQPMNIAVVDDGGNLVAFVAMDDTKLIGADISQKKALTAVYFQTDTRDLVPLVQPGAALYGIESTTGGRLVVFGGGVLLRKPDGAVAGVWASALAPWTRTSRWRRPAGRPLPAESDDGRRRYVLLRRPPYGGVLMPLAQEVPRPRGPGVGPGRARVSLPEIAGWGEPAWFRPS